MNAGASRTENVRGTIIFTDLDGTLLDRETYDHRTALPALDALRASGIPLIMCSSKTRAEQMELRSRLRIDHPFIVEDGSAIYVPKGYFPFELPADPAGEFHDVIALCPSYAAVRAAIRDVVLETGVVLVGYGDLGASEIARLTGLDPDSAARAKDREFQETLVTPLSDGGARAVASALDARGFRLTRGARFFGVTGPSDKGTAARKVAGLFRRFRGTARTVGIGDSLNDEPLLRTVDVPVLVQRNASSWEDVVVPGLLRVEGVGPAGWNRFVLDYLGVGAVEAGREKRG